MHHPLLVMFFAGLGIVLTLMMLARVGGTAFRNWLKAAWIAFMLLFCVRACILFVSLGTGGIVITCIFVVGMAIGIWYNTTHNGWSAWWAKL